MDSFTNPTTMPDVIEIKPLSEVKVRDFDFPEIGIVYGTDMNTVVRNLAREIMALRERVLTLESWNAGASKPGAGGKR